ncbi:MAG: hypothetical protein ACE14V_16800, partial [bacterium]
MKKAIIIVAVLAIVGAGVYFWVIPTFFSAATSTGTDSSPVTTPSEPLPAPGNNTQEFIDKAIAAFPKKELADVGKTASNILKTMDYQAAQNLLPQIDKCAPVFAEFKNAVDAKSNESPADFSPERKVPNTFTAQTLGKLLVVKGMALEKQSNLNEAVDSYLLTAQLGIVFAGKNTVLIQKLTGIALEKIAYIPLKQFILYHPEDTYNLKRIIETLEKAEQKQFPLSEGILGEKKMLLYTMQDYKRYKKLNKSQANRILTETEKIYGYLISVVELPYPQFRKEDAQSKLSAMLKEAHPILRMTVPDFTDAHIRELVSTTDNRLIRILAALELYHNENNAYPNSLSELAPTYLAAVPKDPFCDSDFIYGRVRDTFYLYSIGPDLND